MRALLDGDHSLHALATGWFAGHARDGWASCPITQNGCVRIMSHPGYPNALPVSAVMERFAEASAAGYREFRPDDVSLLDEAVSMARESMVPVSSGPFTCSRSRLSTAGDLSPSTTRFRSKR